MRKPGVAPVDPVIRAVRKQRLTYLPLGALNDLFEAAVAADRDGRPGVLLEAGCALGGSAVVLARAKDPTRPLLVYDVFGMIPAPTEADGEDVHARYETIKSGRASGLGGDTYYGYEPDLVATVRQTFERFGLPLDENAVSLIQGLFQNTITGHDPVALAHIDGDWYESVRTCLDRIGPRLVPGGVMIIDDYFMWSGCRRAVDEFLASHPDDYRTVRRTRLHIERV
ncbi:MAG: TylF/MycF/NovP-related O-methyltransferase [Actinomycetota bacterium]